MALTRRAKTLLLVGVPVAILVGYVLRRRLGAYTVPGPRSERRIRPGRAEPFMEMIRTAARRHPELSGRVRSDDDGTLLLLGLIEQESRFDPEAVSPTGAIGLGQFTRIGREEVRRLMGMRKWKGRYALVERVSGILPILAREHMTDPLVSVEAAALLLASLVEKWSGDVEAALTDYNGGGVPARIVHRAGSHRAALVELRALPATQRSQSPEYSPGVLTRAERFATV